MSMDEVIYSKYRREIQMFDEYDAAEQARESAETRGEESPVEEQPAPQKKERNARVARRLGNAFHTVGEEAQARVSEESRSSEEEPERPAESRSENRGRARRRVSDAFHTVDEETRRRLRNAAQNASRGNGSQDRESSDDSGER